MAPNESVDVLVVGAGPAGSSAAQAAATHGARVLLIERHPCVGLPVQCAEYVPAQILAHVTLSPRCVAQRIRTLRTHLPDGTTVESPAAGYVLERAVFDRMLAAAAWRAGAWVWTGARAIERTERGVLVAERNRIVEVECQVVIGADGPRSTVAQWVEQAPTAFLEAAQAETVLPTPRPYTEVYFDTAYTGGYGWLFPKGETANVGVGVHLRPGADARLALEHLLARLEIRRTAVVGRTGGLVPCGGSAARLRTGSVLLVGDAAGHTHPVTGAGILAAIISGTLAGQAAARAVRSADMGALQDYEREWSAHMGGALGHALLKRRELEAAWSDNPDALSEAIRQAWIAFPSYGRGARPDRR